MRSACLVLCLIFGALATGCGPGGGGWATPSGGRGDGGTKNPTAPTAGDMADAPLPSQPVDPNLDTDHDGYSPNQGDCDDTEPLINPGAVEMVGNSVDDDCNGQ